MGPFAKLVVALACLLLATETISGTPMRTVCTITVNSADEADAFRRALPADRHRFVELIEKGRADWLASACRQGIRCDVLIVSGHYDGAGMFYSDQVDRDEHLPVHEFERVTCSESCPGLFDELQEVHLFGCHTLASEAVKRTWNEFSASADPMPALSARHGESSRERMTRIFQDVPVIYGFSGQAPLGPVAGGTLARFFRAGGATEIGTGRPSARLLAHFAPHGMTSTRGIGGRDPRMAQRRDVCQFADERLTPAQRVAFVHQVLRREGPAIVTLLDPLERFAFDLGETEGHDASFSRALAVMRDDRATRERFLDFARATRDPALHARLVALAHRIGWITAEERGEAWTSLLLDQFGRGARASDVDLACRLAGDGSLDAGREAIRASAVPGVMRDAVLACLGDRKARERVLAALVDGSVEEADIARVLLEHWPVLDATEFHTIAEAIARLDEDGRQARVLDALSRHPLPDAASAGLLARLLDTARSPEVHRAVANILVRSDLSALDAPRLVLALREHRGRTKVGPRDVVDVLLRRLESRERHAAGLP